MERFIDYEGASSSTHRLSSSQTISQDVNLASNSSSRLSPNRENLGLKLRQDSASTEVTADRDYENFAKEAIMVGAHLEQSNNGNTALHWALEKGQHDKLLILLKEIDHIYQKPGSRIFRIKNHKDKTILDLVEDEKTEFSREILDIVEKNKSIDPSESKLRSSSKPFIGVYYLPPGSIDLLNNPILGEGAFGTVFRGQWERHPVALKEITLSGLKSSTAKVGADPASIQEAIGSEIACLSTVSHPNLVQFYGVYQAQNKNYLVMEFCEGGDLEKFLRANPNTSWATRWQWALQLSQGLAHVHHQGILHRDLKAKNVLIDRHHRVRLADLGVAQIDSLLQANEPDAARKGLQDPYFRSPEGTDSFASDVYALGLVFWQLATFGDQPKAFDVNNPPVTEEHQSIPKECPEPFRQLILACWKMDPRERPSAEKVIEILSGPVLSNFYRESTLVKACQKTDTLVHTSHLEGLKYIAPYVTQYRVLEDLDTYWSRLESQGESQNFNLPLKLKKTVDQFLALPDPSTLLLLGESGLGKTLSIYQLAERLLSDYWSAIHSLEKTTSYYPLLIRPLLKEWSEASLKDGMSKALKETGFSPDAVRHEPFLVIVDGYDECKDKSTENLGHLLGLDDYPNAKLLVSCRLDTVEVSSLKSHFALKENLSICYFLPFRITQMLDYLGNGLEWSLEERESYKKRFEKAPLLRSILRNPFVLNLLVQSWETVTQKDFEKLDRWQIYQGFIEHWLGTQKNLLPESAQHSLCKGTDSNLFDSFNTFASEIAFKSFEARTLQFQPALHTTGLSEMVHRWFGLKEEVEKSSNSLFGVRQAKLDESDSTRRRALLSIEDFRRIANRRLIQFEAGSPLKCKSDFYEFRHKSFFEYFVARRVVDLRVKTPEQIIQEGLQLLNTRSLQEEPQTLNFIVEAWQEKKTRALKEPFLQIVRSSRDNPHFSQSASNAITVLNRARVSFSGMDFRKIKIRGADLTSAILDNTNLEGADLTDVILVAAWLYKANLQYSILQGVNFGELPYLAIGASTNCNYSKTGCFVGVLLQNNSISILDAATHKKVVPTIGGRDNFNPLSCFDFHYNGQHLISGALNGMIASWDIQSGNLFKELYQYDKPITGVACNPIKEEFVFYSNDDQNHTVQLLRKGILKIFNGHSAGITTIAFDPDGVKFVSGSFDATLILWDTENAICLKTFIGHEEAVLSVAFHPGGEQLASGSGENGYGYNEEFNIRLWDVVKGVFLKGLKGHTGAVTSLVFHSDGQTLFSGSLDRSIKVWDIYDGMCLRSFEGHHKAGITNIGLRSNGHQLVSASEDGTVKFWIYENAINVKKLENQVQKIISIAIDPSETRLVAGTEDGALMTVNIGAGDCRGDTLIGHQDSVESIGFNNNGQRLVSGGSLGSLRLWDTAQRAPAVLKTFMKENHMFHHMNFSGVAVTSVVFHPHENKFAYGVGNAANLITISDETTKTFDHKMIQRIVFSEDGLRLATGASDGTIKFWDLERSVCLRNFSGKEPNCRDNCVYGIVLINNDQKLVSANAGVIKFWDIASEKLLKRLEVPNVNLLKKTIYDIALGIDNLYLISVGQDGIRLWDVTTEKMCDHVDWLTTVFSVVRFKHARDPMFATGSADGSVRFWRINLGSNRSIVQLQLIWVSNQKSLMLQGACIEAAKGLSELNARLLEQNGASGIPSEFVSTWNFKKIHAAIISGDIQMIESLRNSTFDVNQLDEQGLTLASIAAIIGRTDIIELLHELGANLELPTISGYRPIYLAVKKGHVEMVATLSKLGVDLDVVYPDGNTLMTMAALFGHANIITLLHSLGVNINQSGKYNITAVYCAARGNHVKAIKTLYRLGADLNTPDTDGFTPSYVASTCGHLDTIKILCNLGADINRPDFEGKTPINVAKREGHNNIVRFLDSQTAMDPRNNTQTSPLLLLFFESRNSVEKAVGQSITFTASDGCLFFRVYNVIKSAAQITDELNDTHKQINFKYIAKESIFGNSFDLKVTLESGLVYIFAIKKGEAGQHIKGKEASKSFCVVIKNDIQALSLSTKNYLFDIARKIGEIVAKHLKKDCIVEDEWKHKRRSPSR